MFCREGARGVEKWPVRLYGPFAYNARYCLLYLVILFNSLYFIILIFFFFFLLSTFLFIFTLRFSLFLYYCYFLLTLYTIFLFYFNFILTINYLFNLFIPLTSIILIHWRYRWVRNMRKTWVPKAKVGIISFLVWKVVVGVLQWWKHCKMYPSQSSLSNLQ